MSTQPLSNPSQLVSRNSEWLKCSKLLVLGMPSDGLGKELLDHGVAQEVFGLTRDFSVYRSIRKDWETAGSEVQLSFGTILDSGTQDFDGILIFLQKSKPLMDFWLDMVRPALADGGTVWLVGENNEGIKSWRKRLGQSFVSVKNMDNARHCSLLEATDPVKAVTGFSLDSYYSQYELEMGGDTLKLCSLPGVFSHGRVDAGTRVLLETFTDIKAGRVLDFGCGAGVVAGFMSKKQPDAHFTLVDCDALALESAQKTWAANGVADHEILASDGLSEVSGTFNIIVSNPPFHQGVKTHYEVTEQFLEQSVNRLVKGGELRIVANSFLRYEPIIRKAFGNCKTLVVKNGFSVYQAFKA